MTLSLRMGGGDWPADSEIALPPRAFCALPSGGAPVGPVAQWLEPAAHNGLVAGSSPARPTSQILNSTLLLSSGNIGDMSEACARKRQKVLSETRNDRFWR